MVKLRTELIYKLKVKGCVYLIITEKLLYHIYHTSVTLFSFIN